MRQFLAIFVVPVLISQAALILLSEVAMAQQTAAKPELPVGRDSMPLPLKVIGTRVVNSRNEPVRLRGVNIAGLEWSSNGEGHILTTVDTAIRDWHVNVIRLPLAQDRWFGKVPEPKDRGRGLSGTGQSGRAAMRGGRLLRDPRPALVGYGSMGHTDRATCHARP